jgi:hypothetical protein
MSAIKQIRESVDIKLDKLDARADALQAALGETDAQLEAQIKENKGEAKRALEKLMTDIDSRAEVPQAQKQAIRSVAENLSLQIDLSQSAAEETLASTRRQIHDAIQKMEAEIDTVLGQTQAATVDLLHASLRGYAQALDKLDAALEAAELRVRSAKNKFDASLDRRRQDMVQEIAKFKERLGEKKAQTADKLAGFEADVHGGFEKLAKAVKDLFS